MNPPFVEITALVTPFQSFVIKKWERENKKIAGIEETGEIDLDDIFNKIKKECFLPYPIWVPPTKEEVSILFEKTRMTQKEAASYIGLKDNNGRNFRRFTTGETQIGYSYWVMLCQYVGIPRFW